MSTHEITWKKGAGRGSKVFSGNLDITPDNLFEVIADVVRYFWPDVGEKYYWKDFEAVWEKPGRSIAVLANKFHETPEGTIATTLYPVSVVDVMIEAQNLATSYVEISFSHGQDCLARAVRDHLLSRLGVTPTPAEEGAGREGGKALGTQGGTLARVKTARELIEQRVPKTKACKKARVDPRTYDRYVTEVIDWEETLPDS